MSENENNNSWTCSHCSEILESQFEICWNCGTSKEGDLNPEFELYRETDSKHTPIESAGHIYRTLGISFLLCLIVYLFVGIPTDITPHYHEPDSSAFLGLLAVIIVILFIARSAARSCVE